MVNFPHSDKPLFFSVFQQCLEVPTEIQATLGCVLCKCIVRHPSLEETKGRLMLMPGQEPNTVKPLDVPLGCCA